MILRLMFICKLYHLNFNRGKEVLRNNPAKAKEETSGVTCVGTDQFSLVDKKTCQSRSTGDCVVGLLVDFRVGLKEGSFESTGWVILKIWSL
jgi:hypothetical protein